MLQNYEFVFAFAAYYLATIGLLVVWWRITRFISWTLLKQLVRVLVAAAILVPAPVASNMVDLCPAIFVLLFDMLLVKDGDQLRALLYLYYGFGLGLAVWLADALLRQMLSRRASPPQGET